MPSTVVARVAQARHRSHGHAPAGAESGDSLAGHRAVCIARLSAGLRALDAERGAPPTGRRFPGACPVP